MGDGFRRTVSRSKTMEVTPAGDDRYRFLARLTDLAVGGDFPGESVTIHDFGLTGEVEGPRLTVTDLQVEAYAHPYGECPFVIPATQELIGGSLTSGWRRSLLDRLGGTRGCTHVNTLLLGLSELTTMVFFLRLNVAAPYTPEARDDGRWMREGLRLAPGLAGACHGLRRDGPVLAPLVDESRENGEADRPPSRG
jgi:DUF2889 family protein